jgi:hypothetical protein
MNRGHWKQFSSWQPEEKSNRKHETAEDDGGFSGEVQVKKGYSWSEQIGIAVAALVEEGKSELVEWVKDVRSHVLPRCEHEADACLMFCLDSCISHPPASKDRRRDGSKRSG